MKKYIQTLTYALLIATAATTLKPVKLKLRKSLIQDSELQDKLKAKPIDQYKIKPGPLTSSQKTDLYTYYKKLVKSLITDKKIAGLKLEAEERSTTNPEASNIYFSHVVKRLQETFATPDYDTVVIENAFAKLNQESGLKWVLRFFYYKITDNLIDNENLVITLAKKFVNKDQLDFSFFATQPQQFESFFKYASGAIEPLNGRQITKLSMEWCALTQIDLNNLINLEHLNLNNNALTQFNLKNLPNLKTLTLSNNKLTQIDLNNLTNLEYINLEGNELANIDGFSNLPNLRRLFINKNKLKTIDLRNLQNISTLDLSENQLTEIDLSNLPKLEELSLDDNKLTEVDLSNLKNLEKVWLLNNKFTQELKEKIKKWAEEKNIDLKI